MFEKLTFIEERYEELSKKISDPEVIADNEAWRKLCKEHSDITPIVEKYREYKKAKETIEEAQEMLGEVSDKDFEELLRAEMAQAQTDIERFGRNSKSCFCPKTRTMRKTLLLKSAAVRAGTRPRFLRRICSVCTACMRKRKTGRLIS